MSSLAVLAFLLPSLASASSLTYSQASSIIELLQAFQVDQSVIDHVWTEIEPDSTSTAPILGSSDPITQPAIIPPMPAQPPMSVYLNAMNAASADYNYVAYQGNQFLDPADFSLDVDPTQDSSSDINGTQITAITFTQGQNESHVFNGAEVYDETLIPSVQLTPGYYIGLIKGQNVGRVIVGSVN